ncbi:MAG: hypothetical protein QXF26_06930 [Candidatus Bathyarchaeia archaeon]
MLRRHQADRDSMIVGFSEALQQRTPSLLSAIEAPPYVSQDVEGVFMDLGC